MLDLNCLDRIELSSRPPVQLMIGPLLGLNYRLASVDLVVEGNIPEGPVLFAMNHTDRYNYFPFQYWFWQAQDRFTATWVKGKYYEHPLVRRFMERTNNIPTVSRGYLISKDFLNVVGRRPTDGEYTALRRAAREGVQPSSRDVPGVLLTRDRDMLGRPFRPDRESYADAVRELFHDMMRRFVALNREAVNLGLCIIVFPEGTRSVRLSKGHAGLAQMAVKLGLPVVPVGCSGSDVVYPGASPVGRSGRITYRVGPPLDPPRIPGLPEDFVPFSREAESRSEFSQYVQRVMDHINGLLDEPYRFAEDRRSLGVQGVARFV